MRIGVIRGDLPGPIHLMDLEPVSQFNPPVEAKGQERNIGRPTTAKLDVVLSGSTGAGAIIQGSDISGSFPLTINGTNNVLKVRTTSSAAYSTVTIANSAYTSLGLTATIRTTPSSATFITALNPISGTLNVSNTAINAVGSGNNANALSLVPAARGTQTAIADAIAPKFAETPVVIDSWLVGMIAEYRSASYNPDSRRGLVSGAAIAVVADDGSTTFTTTLPVTSSATKDSPTSGALTIAGTGLGVYDRKETTVQLTGKINKTLHQVVIEKAGGSVTATSIVIPASLLAGLTTVTTFVQVKVRQRVSTKRAVA